MDDPSTLLAVGGGSATVGGFVVWALKALSNRTINQLDTTLKHLDQSITELGNKIVQLQLTDMSQQKDIGALQGRLDGLERRIDGQGSHYRAQIEQLKRGGGGHAP